MSELNLSGDSFGRSNWFFGQVIFGKLLLQCLDEEVKIHGDGMSWGIHLSVMWIGHLLFAERCQIFGALPVADQFLSHEFALQFCSWPDAA